MTAEQKVVYLDGSEKIVYVNDLLDPNPPMRDSDFFRGTGRTNRRALKIIHDAMAKPDNYFPILDHHDDLRAHERLTELVSKIVMTMNVNGLYITNITRISRYELRRIPEADLQRIANQYQSRLNFLIMDTEDAKRRQTQNLQKDLYKYFI